MTTTRLIVYVGLLLAMLAGVVALAVSMPTLPHILLVLVFVLFVAPLIRTALRLHRDYQRDPRGEE